MVIIRNWRAELLEEFGVGPIVAATVLPETSTACLKVEPSRLDEA